MGIVYVHAGHPRSLAVLLHKFNSFFGAPRGLVKFGWHALRITNQFSQFAPPLANPVRIAVSDGPIIPRSVTVLPIAIAVVHSRFNAPIGAGQMQLAN